MTEVPPTFTTGTLQAWTRLPIFIRLVLAIAALSAIGFLAVAGIDTPQMEPAMANAAVGAAPMRDPSVPDAGQALSTDERQQEAWIPTF